MAIRPSVREGFFLDIFEPALSFRTCPLAKRELQSHCDFDSFFLLLGSGVISLLTDAGVTERGAGLLFLPGADFLGRRMSCLMCACVDKKSAFQSDARASNKQSARWRRKMCVSPLPPSEKKGRGKKESQPLLRPFASYPVWRNFPLPTTLRGSEVGLQEGGSDARK